MDKPDLSFWRIWNLSFGFMGVQIGYSLQNSNTSTIFESLGADVHQLSYFWLAAPLAGLVVQPLVGLFSDKTWTRLGRRIPFILGGAIVSAISLALMPNAPALLSFAPLAMGAFILLFMDLSFNVTMQPFRALVADMLNDRQKTTGYVVQTFLINLGAVIGAVLPLLLTHLGVSDATAEGRVSDHIAYSYYIGGAVLLLTVLVTSFKTKEYPPEKFAEYNHEETDTPHEGKSSFMELLRDIPRPLLAQLMRNSRPVMDVHSTNWYKRYCRHPYYIAQFGVDKAHRGSGAARELLDGVIAHAAAQGYSAVVLETLSRENVPMYLHFGFFLKQVYSCGAFTEYRLIKYLPQA